MTVITREQADQCVTRLAENDYEDLSNREDDLNDLRSFIATLDLVPDETPTQPGDVEVYAVTANVSTAQDGWGVTVYGPTMYLHPSVQGILSDDGEETAKRIVTEWLTDVFHNVSRSDESAELIVTAARTHLT